MPVSYTHLDVYKRQGQPQPRAIGVAGLIAARKALDDLVFAKVQLFCRDVFKGHGDRILLLTQIDVGAGVGLSLIHI